MPIWWLEWCNSSLSIQSYLKRLFTIQCSFRINNYARSMALNDPRKSTPISVSLSVFRTIVPVMCSFHGQNMAADFFDVEIIPIEICISCLHSWYGCLYAAYRKCAYSGTKVGVSILLSRILLDLDWLRKFSIISRQYTNGFHNSKKTGRGYGELLNFEV